MRLKKQKKMQENEEKGGGDGGEMRGKVVNLYREYKNE